MGLLIVGSINQRAGNSGWCEGSKISKRDISGGKGNRFMRLYREDKSGEATAEPAGGFVLPLVSSQMGGDSRTQRN